LEHLGLIYINSSPCSALFFLFYENFKKRKEKSKILKFYDYLYLSTFSFAIASLLTNPLGKIINNLDVIKTRFQIQNNNYNFKYNGFLDAFHKIYLNEGLKTFWKGSTARILYNGINAGLINFILKE
jgi:hypothetical protein